MFNHKLLRLFDWRFTGVLALAALLRLPNPGLYQLYRDEILILHSALRLGRHGEWTWIFPISISAAWRWLLPYHSPFTVYLISIPYLFSPDPRAVRLWAGLLGVVTVAIVYLIMRRYFNGQAGLITSVLLAAHAPLVDWSRVIWNPVVSQPFTAVWILTGLLGYYEGKTWGRV